MGRGLSASFPQNRLKLLSCQLIQRILRKSRRVSLQNPSLDPEAPSFCGFASSVSWVMDARRQDIYDPGPHEAGDIAVFGRVFGGGGAMILLICYGRREV